MRSNLILFVVVLVVVLVLVLDPLGRVLHPNFDYENEDEKLSTGHFRHSPFMSGLEMSSKQLSPSLYRK